MRNIPLYLLTAAMLTAAVYLKSPATAVAIVALWGVRAAEDVLTRKNRDIDIAAIQSTLESQQKRIDLLTRDIGNVTERAKTILGDIY